MLALISVPLIAHIVVGSLILSKTIVNGIAIGVLGLAMMILLVLFSVRVRRRTETLVEREQAVVPESMR